MSKKKAKKAVRSAKPKSAKKATTKKHVKKLTVAKKVIKKVVKPIVGKAAKNVVKIPVFKMQPIFSKVVKPAPAAKISTGKLKSILPKKELEEFQELLLNLRSKIAGDIQHLEADSLKKSTEELTGDHADVIDTAHDEFEREFALSLASSEQQIMNKIDDALRRIKDGSYGICEKYGTPIPKKRLLAMPYANLSIRAQEEQEKGI